MTERDGRILSSYKAGYYVTQCHSCGPMPCSHTSAVMPMPGTTSYPNEFFYQDSSQTRATALPPQPPSYEKL